MIECEPDLRKKLWRNAELMIRELKKIKAPVLDHSAPIIPVVLGDEQKTLEASQYLKEQGFYVPAIRYPTVPKGKARLRITVSAVHDEAEIKAFSKCLHAFLK